MPRGYVRRSESVSKNEESPRNWSCDRSAADRHRGPVRPAYTPRRRLVCGQGMEACRYERLHLRAGCSAHGTGPVSARGNAPWQSTREARKCTATRVPHSRCSYRRPPLPLVRSLRDRIRPAASLSPRTDRRLLGSAANAGPLRGRYTCRDVLAGTWILVWRLVRLGLLGRGLRRRTSSAL